MLRSTIAFLCTEKLWTDHICVGFAVVIHGNVIYQPGKFPFSKCKQSSDFGVSCERVIMRTEHEGFPSVLPPGPYALLMSKFGCPESNARGWRRGVIKFEASSIEKDKEYTFCIKLRNDPELDTGRWIPGAYTVFKTGETCPEGFSESTQAWNHSGTVSVFGHVPNFKIYNTTDFSANSSILFEVCVHESTTNKNESDYDQVMTNLVLGKHQESDCPNLNRTFELNVLEEGGHIFCFYMFTHEKLQDINVAVGKRAHISSVYPFDGNSVTHTVDGNLDQHFEFCIRTLRLRDNWWYVDLQNVYKIRRIKLFNGNFYGISFWYGMDILVGDTLSALFKVKVLKYLGYRSKIDMPRNTIGRYIKLRLGEKGYFHLCEVVVYATLAYKIDTFTQLMSSFALLPGILKFSEKISWFYTRNGTLQTSVMKDYPYTWYHIDLQRTLSVFEIEVKVKVLVKRKLFYKEMYIGCLYGDVMLGFLHHESKGCNDDIYFRTGVLRIFPRMARARFVTLLFDEEGQMSQRIRGKESLKIYLSDLPSSETCNEDLGMTDGSIQDLQITASSWLSKYPPWNAKPLRNGWCAEKTDFQPWIMVDLLAVRAIEGVRIWSRNVDMVETDHKASSGFLLFFGTNIDALTEYRDARFNIDVSRNWTDMQTFILLNPVETRYVKLGISDVHTCLKFELQGCQVSAVQCVILNETIGIPSLDCKNSSELFDFDTSIITERESVVQNEETTVDACKKSCLQDTNCSIARYKDNCAHFLPSQFAMWPLSNQKSGRKFGKICADDSSILFPTLVNPEEDIFTHVEVVVKEAVITTIGYPFSYQQGQIYKWLIQFPEGRYIKFVFTNVSFGKTQQECYTKLLISKDIKNETTGKAIDLRYHDRVFVIETGESQLFLTFNSCLIHESGTDRGFRAVIKGEEIKSCLSVDSDNDWSNGRHEVCTETEMFLTSTTFLNLPFVDVDETWEINAINQHTVQLHILDFYIVCPKGYNQKKSPTEKYSKFAVDIANEEKIFCNTNLPPDLINTDTSNVVVKFRKHVDTTKTFFRTEGFRLRYLSVKYSLEKQRNTSISESRICSLEFRKCYHIVSSIKTWSQASDVCFHRYQTLVKVESEDEMNFINYILREAKYRYNFERREGLNYDTSLLAHIGLRRSSNELGQDAYLWEDHSAVIYSGWREGNPVHHMYCTRTNFGFHSHKTWESEHCTKDIAQFFVCQSSTEDDKTEEYYGKLLTCRHGWRRYKDSCYYFSDDFGHQHDTRDNASKICENLGAFLAEIENVEENSFLGTIVMEKQLTKHFWIGIEHLVNKGKIVWSSSGKEVTFTHWRYESEGEMDNEEYCGALTVDKTWLARECSTIQYNFICEKNSERTTHVCGDGFSDRYRSVKTTYTGNDCQNWDDLTTAADNDFKARFPSVTTLVNASNYCLDPSSSGMLWCYTTNSDLYVWEPCFISSPDVEDRNARTTNETFKCKDGSAISILNRCDGVFHCSDLSDETFCTVRGQVLTNNARYNVSEEYSERLRIGPYFHCGSNEWISILALCDDIIDCLDASDESDCFEDSKEADGSCSDYGNCAQNDGWCDFSLFSTDGERDFREFTQCDTRFYTCNNGQCISLDKRCDAIIDCADRSDENQCGFCNGAFHCDNVKCIPQRLICDMYPDCEDGSDEATCFPKSPSSCVQWWEQGYHDSGEYLIDGVKVVCNFAMKNTTDRKISMTIKGLDVEVIKQTGYFFTNPLFGYNQKNKESNIQHLINRDGYVCSIEVYTLCKWNAMASTIKSLYDKGYFHVCTCKVESFRTNKGREKIWRKVETNNNESSVFSSPQCYSERSQGSKVSSTLFYNLTQDGHLSFEEYLLKEQFPAQIKHGPITCVLDYVNDGTSNVFVCKDDSRTIPKRMECIYDVDSSGFIKGCRSGSHLKNCSNFPCPEKTVKCPDSYCIPLHFVCDRKIDCPGGQDEFECTCSNTTTIEVVILVEDALTVTEISTAARMLAEQFYNNEESRIRLLFYTTQTPLSEYNLEHRLLDIREEFYQTISRKIECSSKYMARNLLGSMKFKANTTKSIIFLQESVESAKVAEIMFANLSMPAFDIYRVLKSVEVNKTDTYRYVTDIYVNKWSGLYTFGYRRFPKICEAITDVPCSGGYRCSSSKQCLSLDQVCDGIPQCNGKDDEQLCDFFCPKNCKCVGYSVDCRAVDLQFNEAMALSYKTRRADLSKNPALHNSLRTSSLYSLNMIRLNLSACEITNITEHGFSYLGSLECLDIGYNNIKILQNNTFRNLRNLVSLNLDGNFELQVISTTAFHGLVSLKNLRITGSSLKRILMHTFYGLTLQTIDISYNQIEEIEDYAFSNSSVEKIDLRGNEIVIFNERIFNGVESLKDLATPAFKFCCIRPCYVEEAACLPKKNEFSSCGDLMRHPILQAVLWFVGITALFGNFGSVIYRLVYDRERLQLGYGIFVTNLALADFLMGVYLIIIAVTDSLYRNRYIFVDDKWRNSRWCVAAGVFSTVSSEASVLFLCLITVDRLLVIKYPFGTIRFGQKEAHISCLISWIIAFILALLPLVHTSYFQGKFYSRSGVCVALPLTRDKPPGWMYSVCIFVGLNFCTFVLVAAGQISIFRALKKTNLEKTLKSRKKDLQVARNLILVATTDFLCWFPVGIMGIMALNGYPISGDVYAWTVVFIIPLNSALNPMLYTLTAILGKQSFNPSTDEQNRTEFAYKSGPLIVRYQSLLQSVRIKSDIAQPGKRICDLYEEGECLSVVSVIAIAWRLSKFLSLLHESCVSIKRLTADDIYVKFHKQNLGVSIVIDSKLTVSSDKKALHENIHQFGIILQLLESLTRQKYK